MLCRNSFIRVRLLANQTWPDVRLESAFGEERKLNFGAIAPGEHWVAAQTKAASLVLSAVAPRI